MARHDVEDDELRRHVQREFTTRLDRVIESTSTELGAFSHFLVHLVRESGASPEEAVDYVRPYERPPSPLR